MKFGKTGLDEALGGVLAHSVRAGARKLRKGTSLGPDDIAALRQAGYEAVTTARLDPDDVGEDAAARRLAHALVPDPDRAGLRIGGASTGRVNLHATGPGILAFDTGAITALNRINPMMTLATLPLFRRLDERVMTATIKIISYAVDGASVAAFEAAAAAANFRVLPPVIRTAQLIETLSPGQTEAAKGRAAVKARLDRLGVSLMPRLVVEHDADAVAAALAAAGADLALILTGSATSDTDDVGPAAVRAAGGAVERFGMPVDPGNLLFLGQIGAVPVIGLPGCARSPALNGADWVLERIICGVPVTGEDIAAMGVGGLLKEPPSRPSPRQRRLPSE